MPRKKAGRPMWFRSQLSIKPILCTFSDADVGRAYKLVYEYFDTGALPGTDESVSVLVLFQLFKAEADKSFDEYAEAVDNGYKSRNKRIGVGGVPHPYPPSPGGTLGYPGRENRLD